MRKMNEFPGRTEELLRKAKNSDHGGWKPQKAKENQQPEARAAEGKC